MKLKIVDAIMYDAPHLVNNLGGTAWVGHIPFSFWLVAYLKPKILVELGTHGGASYFSFCDSILANKLSTSAYAVDNWKGDQNTGGYGADVFLSVNEYNENNFKKFSKLLKIDFDQAVSEFEDQSIDLLHLDGCHSYKAISHDFRTWLPKLAKNSIVLFHDTHEDRSEFGVKKFWNELKKDNPENCFEFDHCGGLGVYLTNLNSRQNSFSENFKANFELSSNIFSVYGKYLYHKITKRHSKLELSIQQIKEILTEIKLRDPILAGKLKNLL